MIKMMLNSTTNMKNDNNYTTANKLNKGEIYKKIQRGKRYFLEAEIKQSGRNNYQKYNYFELADIEPIILDLCDKEKLSTRFNFTVSEALLIIRDEETGEEVYYSIPLPVVNTHDPRKAMQEIGSLQTYAMRYLYLQAFEIVVQDTIDVHDTTRKQNKQTITHKTMKQTQPKTNQTQQQVNNTSTTQPKNTNVTKVTDNNELTRTEIEYAIKDIQQELKKEGLKTTPEFIISRATSKYGKNNDLTQGIIKLYRKVEENYNKKYVVY